MSSGRRHSVSVSDDHHHHRRRRDHDHDSAHAGSAVNTSRRHSPERRERHRAASRARSHHADDYDPRDRFYLSGEEDQGFRSQSTTPQLSPRDDDPRTSTRDSGHVDGDYFSSRRRQTTAGCRRDDPSPDDLEAGDRRGGAPPMRRRMSNSAPPPFIRSAHPPPSNGRRNGGSKYPPSTTETRRYPGEDGGGGGGGRGGSSSSSRDRRSRSQRNDNGHDRGRRSRNSRDNDNDKTKAKDRGDLDGYMSIIESAFGDVAWSQVVKCGLEAGSMAALRSLHEPGDWVGTRGAKVATAAVGAALVDGLIASKKPNLCGGRRQAILRQMTNTALGTIMAPAGKSIEKREPVNRARQAMIGRMHRH